MSARIAGTLIRRWAPPASSTSIEITLVSVCRISSVRGVMIAARPETPR